MNDLMAVGFMDAALNDGVRIPEDVSVIGFDNRQGVQIYQTKVNNR